MFARKKDRPARRGWRGVAVLTGCVVVVAAAGYWVRSAMLPRADAQTPVPIARTATPAPAPAKTEEFSDYSKRVVAYLYESEPITREQLGDYLVDRYGRDKIELLLNKRIIDDACRHYNVEVTAGEVDSALGEELQGLAIDQKTFINTLLVRYHKNLYEWKEDVIRPKIQFAKLCRGRVQVGEEEIRKAFEAAYGEKIECQIILWPKSDRGEADALADYARLRDSAEAFDRRPRPAQARIGGHRRQSAAVRPLRHGRRELRPHRLPFAAGRDQRGHQNRRWAGRGEVPTPLSRRRLPPPRIRPRHLVKQILDKKVVAEMQTVFDTLKKQAAANILIILGQVQSRAA